MLAIKLQRVGKKHQPSFRVVVANKRSNMPGPPVEDVGSYSTVTKQAHLKTERVTYWLGVGAQPTVTVHNLLVNQGVLAKPKIAVKIPKKAVAEAPVAEAAPAHAASAAAPAKTEDSDVEVFAKEVAEPGAAPEQPAQTAGADAEVAPEAEKESKETAA